MTITSVICVSSSLAPPSQLHSVAARSVFPSLLPATGPGKCCYCYPPWSSTPGSPGPHKLLAALCGHPPQGQFCSRRLQTDETRQPLAEAAGRSPRSFRYTCLVSSSKHSSRYTLVSDLGTLALHTSLPYLCADLDPPSRPSTWFRSLFLPLPCLVSLTAWIYYKSTASLLSPAGL